MVTTAVPHVTGAAMESGNEPDQPRRKKPRRVRKSKSVLTGTDAVEGKPFKDVPGNGINIGLPGTFQHVLLPASRSAEDPKITGMNLLNNIMKVNVGVSYKTLMNRKIAASTNLNPFLKELDKLLKEHRRLHVYQKIVFASLSSVFLDTCSETYSCKVVFHVIYFIMSRVLPSSLLGSKENLKLFMKQVRRVVFGCHRQSFSLSSLVHGQKVGHVSWLNSAPSNSLRLHILARLIKWLLLYVQGVLWRLFYFARDTSNRIVYYNKYKWKQRERGVVSLLVANNRIQKLENGSEEIKKLVDVGRTQFLIKTNGLRPITIFGVPDEAGKILRCRARMLLSQWAYFSGSLNTRFNPAYHEALQNGLLKIVCHYPEPSTRPFYYFVRTDVNDAFGSIDQCKLSTILDLLHQKTVPRDNKMNIWQVYRKKNGRKPTYSEMFECPNMPIPSSFTKTEGKIFDIQPIFHYILSRINHLGTVIGRTTYCISHGIPQGMDLSSILCEIYYSMLDREHLASFQQTGNNELFLRYCDDYLFLSPSKERTEQFLQKVSSGFPDYHVQFNHSKTVTNISTGSTIVSFCGFNIDLSSFNVKNCFDSLKNRDVGHHLKLDGTQHPGKILLRRMKLVLKLYPVLIDRRVNSKHTVAENVYRAALLMAFRFIGFVRYAFFGKKLTGTFAIKCIKVGYCSIRNKVMRVTGVNGPTGFGAVRGLSNEEIKWLVYQAFLSCMAKKSSLCPDALKYLKAMCKKILKKMNKFQVNLLRRISTPSLPGVFSTLK